MARQWLGRRRGHNKVKARFEPVELVARCSLVVMSVAHLTCVLFFIPKLDAMNLGVEVVIAIAVGIFPVENCLATCSLADVSGRHSPLCLNWFSCCLRCSSFPTGLTTTGWTRLLLFHPSDQPDVLFEDGPVSCFRCGCLLCFKARLLLYTSTHVQPVDLRVDGSPLVAVSCLGFTPGHVSLLRESPHVTLAAFPLIQVLVC